MKTLIYGGTFGEPEVMEAMAGRPIAHREVILEGFELVRQPLEKADQVIQSLVNNSWNGMFLDAYGLRPEEGAFVNCTLYEVDEDFFENVLVPRLEYWNYYGEGKKDWFRWEITEGFITERLVDDEDLEPVAENFREDLRYRPFILQMIQQIKDDPNLPEGQVSTQKERL